MNVLILLSTTLTISVANAQDSAGGAGKRQILFTGNVFYMSDQSSQGGDDLPGGDTTYLNLNIQNNHPTYWSGFGVYYLMNRAGTSQLETGYGVRLELFYPGSVFYAEYVPYGVLSQQFSNRSIKTREGTMTAMGIGVRPPLWGPVFFDGCFKIRESKYTKEDGQSLPSPIERTERLPYLGIGVAINL